MNSVTLKWGSLKAWKVESEEAIASLKKYFDSGPVSDSAIMQKDTPEQREAVLELIDHADEIWLDWDGRKASREEAKEYIRNYGKESNG